MQGLGIFSGSLLLSDVVVQWWLSVNAELYSVGISFRICLSLSIVPSRLSPLSLNSVFSLCPLLGLFRLCS